MHLFTSLFATFQKRLNDIEIEGRNSDERKAVVDVLGTCLTFDWHPSNNVNRFHEKLVILITDGPSCDLVNGKCPSHGNDLWKMSDPFEKQDIILVVVGIEPGVVVCTDFYCALAHKIGGEYLPMINATRVLTSVILRVMLKEDTLSQLFCHLNIQSDLEYNSLYRYSSVQPGVRYMIEHCQTMFDIRKRVFTYRGQPNASDNDSKNIDDDMQSDAQSDEKISITKEWEWCFKDFIKPK
ncbi:unnamed protein product [Rotaria sordida]|uniref:Uncharacterized protein n=1 Tax=Rotaria sordida TaxID=392033 RepID=A0A818UZG2_9BILA|nr:unnamed protein product [Rotaria sordida]CAF1030224.1 unnamed protein product [Rotaria sordida]CAF3504221.1 unnamed protein product [Rotaria sordida]CAF3705009.1 unnamed protein product [Rotaria sordida]